MTRKRAGTKFKGDIDLWATWQHVIADIEYWVIKDLEDVEAVTKLEALELYAEYLNEIIIDNINWEYRNVM